MISSEIDRFFTIHEISKTKKLNQFSLVLFAHFVSNWNSRCECTNTQTNRCVHFKLNTNYSLFLFSDVQVLFQATIIIRLRSFLLIIRGRFSSSSMVSYSGSLWLYGWTHKTCVMANCFFATARLFLFRHFSLLFIGCAVRRLFAIVKYINIECHVNAINDQLCSPRFHDWRALRCMYLCAYVKSNMVNVDVQFAATVNFLFT